MRTISCDVCGKPAMVTDGGHPGSDLLVENDDPQWTLDLCGACYARVRDAIANALVLPDRGRNVSTGG